MMLFGFILIIHKLLLRILDYNVVLLQQILGKN